MGLLNGVRWQYYDGNEETRGAKSLYITSILLQISKKDSVLMGCGNLGGQLHPDISGQRNGVIFEGQKQKEILSCTAAKM